MSENEAFSEASFIYVPWKELVPTYRGKVKDGAKRLDTSNIKRFSIMMRR